MSDNLPPRLMTLGQLRIHARELGITSITEMSRRDLTEAVKQAHERELRLAAVRNAEARRLVEGRTP